MCRARWTDTSLVENIEVARKQYGVHVGQPTVEPSFHFDLVSDVFQARGLYLAYNYYGLYQSMWSGNVRTRDIYESRRYVSLLQDVL